MAVKLHSTSKYPTSLIVRGADQLGVELAKSLLEQGGYVIMVDYERAVTAELLEPLLEYKLFTLLDFTSLATLEDDLRRLDYVFYLQHKSHDLRERISSQEFLQSSNYLDSILDLTTKFEAKFLLTTSIKAHQITMSGEDADIAHGFDTPHSIYTDVEIQRYSEGLVDEYQQKVGIDSRIVRLGEMLGKGMNLASNTKLVQLIHEAIMGEHLRLPGDGLDSDYYIHYLDAAYGLLKAQFSMNTRGKTFTLANDEEVTLLSIAYKLLEIEPGAKEILFDQDDNNLPPLKLYRPAPNLNTIGWKPRVSLERSLAQSVDFLRTELEKAEVEDEGDDEGQPEGEVISKKKGGLLTFLRDFFFITESSKQEEEDVSVDGALQRLVQERKAQERARKGSIVMANTKLRQRLKPKPQTTALERFSGRANDWFFRFRRQFYFLRNITLGDFLLMLGGIAALAVIYFLVVSPIFSLARNVWFIRSNLSGLNGAIQAFDLEASESRAATIKQNLAEAQERTGELRFLFDLTQNHDQYLYIQALLDDGNEYISGFLDVASALRPLQDYTKEFDPNITYRFTDTNTLTVNPIVDSGVTLDKMQENKSLLKIGVDRMQKSREDIDAGLDRVPEWLSDMLVDDIQSVNGQFDTFAALSDTYEYIPLLIGGDSPKTYLIVVQDNARYTAGGGEISGLIAVDMVDGTPQSITITTPDELTVDTAVVDSQVLSNINLLANKDVTESNVTISDMSLISDDDLRLKTVGELYEQKFNKDLNGVIMMNLNVMEQFLQANGSLSYQQVEFNDDSLLTGINILLGDQRSGSYRNEVIMNLYALLIEREFNSLDGRLSDLFSVLAQARQDGDIALYSDKIDAKNYIVLSSPENFNTKDTVAFGLNYDQDTVVINKYPIVTINAVVTVNADFTTSKQIEIAASGVEGLQNSYVCSPSGSRNFTYQGVTDLLVSNTFTADRFCTIFLEDDDLRYGVSYETIPFENSSGAGYNYVLSLEKNPGIGANYDIEFSFDPSLNVTPVDSSFIAGGDSYIYSGVITGDTRFIFEITN